MSQDATATQSAIHEVTAASLKWRKQKNSLELMQDISGLFRGTNASQNNLKPVSRSSFK